VSFPIDPSVPGFRLDRGADRVVDIAVLLWTLSWLAVAVGTGAVIWKLSSIGGTLTQSGEAVGSAADALRVLGNLPLVGETPRRLADEAGATAGQVIAEGRTVTTRLRQLAVLLGLMVFLVPVTPVLALWAPVRLRRGRDARMIRKALSDGAGAPLDRYLAHRAMASLPFAEVRAAFEDPEGRLTAAQERALADAELRRLGLRRPAGAA
jgi:hypothetical protein